MKKILTVILSLLIIGLCVVPSLAVADNAKLTYLYLDKGNIVIGDGTVSGYGYFGEVITTPDEDGYYITQSTTDTVTNTLTFNGGTNYAVISNLKMSMSSQFVCAVNLTNSADITLNLEGTNVLVSGASRAGIEVSVGSTLTIMGDGKVMAGSNGQAGIGGGNGNSSGTVIINSGTVVAQSKSNSAGIGGGSAGSNGKVVINGGNVTAVGGPSGAGIGGGCTGDGGEIIINGGTVTATGGTNAAGIGGGWYGSMGEIIIDGGSVKAIGGTNAPSLGAGAGVASGTVTNSLGELVYLAKVNTSSVSSVKDIYTNGKANNLSSYHTNDSNFYFFLPDKTHILAADSDESITSYWKADFNTAFTCNAVTPFECVNSSSVQGDDIFRGLSCGLTDLNDYISLSDGFSFDYSDSVIGTGTRVDLVYNGQAVFSYKALIYGDLNGDGFYDGEDSVIASLMLWGHLTSSNTESFYFEAADVNRSSSVDTNDIATLQQAGLLLQSVPQNEDGTVDTDSTQWEEYILLVDQTDEKESDFLLSLMDFVKFIVEYIKNIITSLLIV
ncbi:MAG: hypothetical protein IJZ57_08825 [Clostridia bacterium]|nr:hypothetical protein [Clostridia bacterium]